MQKRLALVLALAVLVGTLCTGCLFNIFQTARTIGAGNVAFTLGTGFFTIDVEEETSAYVTPQARLAVGLADGIDLGLQSGAMVAVPGGDPGWLGLVGDLKFSLFDEPESFALALGFGGGYSVEFLGTGWGAFGEIFLDSNLRVLPIFFAYQPGIPIGGDSFVLLHHFAGGLKLKLSEQTRLLVQADYRGGLLSFGLALEVGF